VAAVVGLTPYMTSATSVGSSNATGLSSGFTYASELVNPATGISPGTGVPAGVTIPTSLINSLGDILSTCINSTGGTAADGSPCGQLFLFTTAGGTAAPTNTVAALLDLAYNPAANTASLFGLVTPAAPFQPTLSVAPGNFGVSASYQPSQQPLQISPAALTFPITATGTTSSVQSVTVQNMSSAAVTISAVSLTGINAAEFSQSNNCVGSIAGSANCAIQVTVKPTAQGTQSAFLQIDSNSVASPQFVALAVSNPVPAISSFSPATVPAGATAGVTVTLYGSNLVPSSTVQVGGSNRPTTYGSPTAIWFQLTAADGAAPGNLSVTVTNPTPAGGVSAAKNLPVYTPATPVIGYAIPNSFLVGSGPNSIIVHGSNLTSGTVIEWNGIPLTTFPYMTGSVTAVVPGSLLTSAGTASLSLYDPASIPPGSSGSVSVTISNPPVPTVSSLSASAGPFNMPTQLIVNGGGFTTASSVTVNGIPAPTTYNGSLVANIPASLLATPGNYNIGVTTAPPGGGISTTTLVYTAFVALANNSMVYNPANGLLYVSVPGSAGAPYGNSVVSVDPATGALGTPIFVGSEPDKLALTPDGRYLWVGLDGSVSVRKVDLVAGTAGLQFAIPGFTPFNNGVPVLALAALPGATDSVIVATSTNMPAIYDAGVLRGTAPAACPTLGECVNALYVDPARGEVYAAGGAFYWTYTYGASGLTLLASAGTITSGYYDGSYTYNQNQLDEFQVLSGKVYSDFGSAFDAESGAKLGTFYQAGYYGGQYPANGPEYADTGLGKIFYLDTSAAAQFVYDQIAAYNLADYTASSAPPIPITVIGTTPGTAYTYASRLTRWGSNGLAFRTAAAVYSVRSNSVNDLSSVNADLGITVSASGANTSGSNTTYTATITNAGPSTSTNVVFNGLIPSTGVLVSASTSTGTCSTSSAVVCDLGTLANGATATVNVIVNQLSAGTSTFTANVYGSENDPNPSNNQAIATATITGNTYSPVPTAISINPSSILSGSNDTVITVTGSGFTNTSSVTAGSQWLSTTFVSSTQLQAVVPAAMLTTLGWTPITVTNPSPGGGTSVSLPLSIFSVLSTGANHILYDPFTRKIMASIPSGAPITANSVVAITPETTTTGTPVPIGDTPTKLALSSDGQILYTILSGSNSVARYNMLTQQPDYTFALASTYNGSTSAPRDLAVQPGTENTIALDLGQYVGTAIFDFNPATTTAAIRGQANGQGGGSCLQFANANNLMETDTFDFGNNSYYTTLMHYPVPSGGFLFGAAAQGTGLNGFGCVATSNGIAYGTNGGVADPSTTPATSVGVFPNSLTNAIFNYNWLQNGVPDTSLKRSFFLVDINAPCSPCYVPGGIAAYNQTNFLETDIASLTMSTIEGNTSYKAVDLIRWGQDGLAALTSSGRVYLLRGPVVVPQELNSNTAATLTSSSPNAIAHGSGNTLVTFTGSNFVPGVGIFWNGTYRTTTIVDATHVTAAIPASDLTTVGTPSITAVNPGAPASNVVAITIN
jgi:trimeric autotransporter adhesin